MIDQRKIEAARAAIRSLATEYDVNGAPDVGNTLREIADLASDQIVRLQTILAHGKDALGTR